MEGVKKAGGFGVWVPRSETESYLVMGRMAYRRKWSRHRKTYEDPGRSIHMLHAMRFTLVIL